MSDQNWQPGQPLPLDPTEINPYRSTIFSPNSEGGGYDRTVRNRNRSRTGSDLFRQLSQQDIAEINEAIYISKTVQHIEASKAAIAHEHHIKSSQLSATLQSEINTVIASLGGVYGVTPVEVLTRQQTALTHLAHTKTAEQNNNQARSNAFYGGDPLARTQQDLVNVFLRIPASEVLHRWTDSYMSAYAAQRNAEELRQLTNRLHVLSYQLAQAEVQRVAILQAEAAAKVARATAEADRAARAAAEKVTQANTAAKLARQREMEKYAEQQRKNKFATDAMVRFDSILLTTKNQPEDTHDTLLRLQDKYRHLFLANKEAEDAELEVDDYLSRPRIINRMFALIGLETELDDLVLAKYGTEQITIPTINGADTSARPLVVTSYGQITEFEGSTFSFSKAFDSKNGLRAALTNGPIGVFLASVFYTPTLGNGELQRDPLVLTIPLSQFYPQRKYLSSGSPTLDWLPHRVVSSVRGEHTQLYLESHKTSFGVRTRQVSLDPKTQLYTFTTEGLTPITLTWTPDSPPDNDVSTSTELPATSTGIKIYPGARVTQIKGHIAEHPACDFDDPDDYILEFPVESGIEPIYMMASRGGPRYQPGMATGRGQEVGDNWLGSAAESNGAPVPAQIADQMRGQDFSSFNRFRENFWKAVATDESLRRQFGRVDLEQMANGAAPYAEPLDSVGGREKIEIHHKRRITDGGEVYDLENLSILTPKAHIELHKKGTQQ